MNSKRIREWCKQKEVLVSLKKKGTWGVQRGAGGKALDVDLEDALFSWIVELRSRNLRVSPRMGESGCKSGFARD